jgi:hypothetical protein
MKRKIEKRSESTMKFFTPELYLRYNSADDADADRADEDWERAILEYKNHLSKFSKEMSSRAKDLAENLCLHDAELLSLQEDTLESSSLPVFPVSIVIVALKKDSKIVIIIYILRSKVVWSRPLKGWSFSKLRTHWLYDEIDFEEEGSYYWHRILLSDGRVISIPFIDVIVQAFSEQNPETAIASLLRA